MKTLQYQNEAGQWEVLPIIQAYPLGGEQGQVLTKAEQGVEWKTLEEGFSKEDAESLLGDYYTKEEVDNAISETKKEIFGDGELADAFDTIQEIGEYLKDHDEVADAINEAIAKKADKTELRKGCNVITDITSIPVDKKLCSATISDSSELGLEETLEAGEELHVIINNSSADVITVAIPTAFKTLTGDVLEIAAGSFGEINIISDGTNLYLRAL